MEVKKPTIEYVMSAPLYGIFPNKVVSKLLCKKEIRTTLQAYGWIMRKAIKASCKNYAPLTSVLYNGFTEANQIENFNYFGRLELDNIYADSGGLQIITRGMSVTDEIKYKIYQDQMYADYAMCFDVISLSSTSKTRTKNERALVDNKVFNQDNHKEAGVATGKNIKQQIEAFKEKEAKTKIIIIVQGNDKDDMIMFFNEIEKQLDEDDYNYIGGFAVADTCIGNGQLESVEMLRAAKYISENSHKNVAQHLHLLGIGSVYRMVPVIFLKKSGYLDKIDYISYDSSTHTSSFSFGNVRIDGKSLSLGSRFNRESYDHFSNLYEMFKFFLETQITKEKFINIIFEDQINSDFGDKVKGWSIARINDRMEKTDDLWLAAFAYTMKCAHTFYQVENFSKCIDGLFNGKFVVPSKYSNVLGLETINDEPQMLDWLNLQKQSSKTKTKRIKREENVKSIEGFFSD